MKRYVFLSNSPKPTEEERKSREKIELSNVSQPYLEVALDLGYEVYFGVNRSTPQGLVCDMDIHLYDSHTYRSLFDLKSNFIAYRNLMKLLKIGGFELLHCNTPIGGVIGRVCGKKANIKKVIYTAHGFHFYKGAPLINRTIFKWAEKIMAHYTDAIITMNLEDYEAAKEFKLRNEQKVYYIPGVGIDTKAYKNIHINREDLRKSTGLKSSDVVLISMGDLIKRKNYESSIKAIANCNNPNIHFLICGKGPELEKLKALSRKLNVEQQIHFLGFRKNIKELLKISDIFLFTTYQEGLPRSMMEAMASGLPCIASKIRGNVDLIEDEIGGFLREPNDIDKISECITILADNPELRKRMSLSNLEAIRQFDIEHVKKKVEKIYIDILGD
ncbi:glycosyltransferase family 4 protein [Paenibacillus sp. FSL E2-8871]|uniref:glycosyltransferase family 4 protein n=1 Tax=Paenibacillus sp. FSL E2-8871 TaxID=2975326 RepID=UPI0030F4D51E